MKIALKIFGLIVMAALLFGCSGGGEQANVTGWVTYTGSMVLPDNAVVEVDLTQNAQGNKAAKLIASQIINTQGKQVPISFSVPYYLENIDPTYTYVLQANITVGDKVLFMSDQDYPVITQGNPTSNIEVMLEPR